MYKSRRALFETVITKETEPLRGWPCIMPSTMLLINRLKNKCY